MRSCLWLLLLVAAGCRAPPGGLPEADAGPDGVAVDLHVDQGPGELPSDASLEVPELVTEPDAAPETNPDATLPCPRGLPLYVTPAAPGTWLVRQDGADLYLTLVEEGTVRLRWRDAGASATPDTSYAVVPQDVEVPAHTAAADPACGVLVLETGRLRVEAWEEGVSVAHRGQAPDGAALPGAPFYRTLSIPERDPSTGQVSLSLALDPGDHLYGFGEKTGALDRRGRTLTFWNFDPLAWGDYTPASEPLYQSVPAGLVLRDGVAWGVYTDNPRCMVFDLGDTDDGT
ncbi:MAG: hypothetical protein FJ098_17060, partial [Deltaproteobacteria bacterium]|nr:hypothetical protein [Deltaproteobacteria bacterium]